MKKISKILIAMGFLGGLLSCEQDNELNTYTPAETQVSFYTNILPYDLTEDQNNVITINVSRTDAGGALNSGNFDIDSVQQITYGDVQNITDQNIFKMKSTQASFPANSGNGTIEVVYNDIFELNGASEYRIYISNRSENISPTKVSQLLVTAMRVLTYNDMSAKSIVTSGMFEKPYECMVQKAEGAEFYKIIDFYGPGGNVIFNVAPDGVVRMERQFSGMVHPTYGNTFVQTIPTEENIRVGNVVSMVFEFTVSAGSFGPHPCVIELPE